jgi:hypothetical protein
LRPTATSTLSASPAREDLDAVLPEGRRQLKPRELLVVREHSGLALDERDLAPQFLERLCQLEAHPPGAHDDHAARDLPGRQRLTVRPHAVDVL